MIGDTIKALREERMLTQAQMAEKTGININTLASYERNIREPRIETIEKLCRFFDVSADYMIGLSSYRTPTQSKHIDSFFQELSPDMQRQIIHIQLELLKTANHYSPAPVSLFDELIGDIDTLIEAYNDILFDFDRYDDRTVMLKFLDRIIHMNIPDVMYTISQHQLRIKLEQLQSHNVEKEADNAQH